MQRKLNSDVVTVNRKPTSENEHQYKKINDDSIWEDTILRLNQTLQNHLKVSFDNTVYNLTKYERKQIIDTKIIENPSSGGYSLLLWITECNDEDINGKIQKSTKSTKTNKPMANT